MAKYIYECEKCQKTFEVEKPMAQSANDEKCSACGQIGRRIFTAPAMHVKGAKVVSPVSPKCTGCENSTCDLSN